ncbi:MAG TPA: pyridoxamine 5'-phosphate oxidase family protein, partial [Candidatus Limnocylindria bacterium]|nr:pyridoxamine 5'-phosphate oxidase family protein [Candidatus Limnocylindria bacterium]
DRYGNEPLLWSRPRDLLASSGDANVTFFLSTTDPDGRPHAAGVGARCHDGDLYIVSGPATRKTKNLLSNPACALSVALTGIDLVLEGEAAKVEDLDLLGTVAREFHDGGWPCEVKDGRLVAPYSAPSAGPPPWDLYRLTFDTVVGVAGAEPHGATRWRFSRAR